MSRRTNGSARKPRATCWGITGAGTVTIRAQSERGELKISVSNRREGEQATAAVRNGRRGLGLANIQARLDQLYPGSHRLEHGAQEAGYDVTVTIPCRQ